MNQTKIELDESNSISLELPKQLKKSKYFYLDKKSNFWGTHQLTVLRTLYCHRLLIGCTRTC